MQNHKGGGDVEAGDGRLYPTMQESPELRWGFIRKVYVIVFLQLVATIAVSLFVVLVRPVHVFFMTIGFTLCIVLIILTLSMLIPLCYFPQNHLLHCLWMGLLTIALAFSVGLSCTYSNGKAVLEAVILTSVVLVSLTLYTFWAAKRGHDFQFLRLFLFGTLMVLIVFGLIQIFFPMGRLIVMIWGCLVSIISCGYIIYDTNSLIKDFNYDEYIWATVALHLDIIDIFLCLLFAESNTFE